MTEPPPAHPPFTYVDTPAGVAALGEALRAERAFGIDTESDSMHSYFEKVCLLQFALPGDRFFLVDPLRVKDLSPLGPALADPSIRKVLHGADYDIVCLKRDFRFTLRGTFDTMTGALLLGLEKIGLQDLVKQEFGVALAKAFTRSDWAARPLSAGQLEYLVQDVQFLIGLAERVEARLVAADLGEEAAIEFLRLEERVPAPREFDPWAFLRIRGARELPERGRAVLRELVLLREETSRAIDRPPFKVLANDTLVRLAQATPDGAGRLRGVKGVTPYLLRRYGDEILAAVRRGIEAPDQVPDRAPPRADVGGESRMGLSAQRRLGRLKEWRKHAAEKAGRTTLAVLPNPAMFDLAKNPPPDVETLAAMPGVGAHRASLYGPEILTAAGVHPPPPPEA